MKAAGKRPRRLQAQPDGVVLGERIREFRRAAGMSQKELAAAIGSHQTMVGKVERGERQMFIDEFEAIARGIGVSAEVLLIDRPGNRYQQGWKDGHAAAMGTVRDLLASRPEPPQ